MFCIDWGKTTEYSLLSNSWIDFISLNCRKFEESWSNTCKFMLNNVICYKHSKTILRMRNFEGVALLSNLNSLILFYAWTDRCSWTKILKKTRVECAKPNQKGSNSIYTVHHVSTMLNLDYLVPVKSSEYRKFRINLSFQSNFYVYE